MDCHSGPAPSLPCPLPFGKLSIRLLGLLSLQSAAIFESVALAAILELGVNLPTQDKVRKGPRQLRHLAQQKSQGVSTLIGLSHLERTP